MPKYPASQTSGGGGGASDATLTTTDVTTGDVSSTKHGFAPKSPADANKVLNGAATPAFTYPTFMGVRCKNSGNQTIASSATWTAITWDGESFDTNSFHDNSTNTSRITVPTGMGGYYQLSYQLSMGGSFGATANKLFVAQVYKNGSAVSPNVAYGQVISTGQSNSPDYLTVTDFVNLAAADYIEIFVYQDGGSNKDVRSGGDVGWFAARFMGV